MVLTLFSTELTQVPQIPELIMVLSMAVVCGTSLVNLQPNMCLDCLGNTRSRRTNIDSLRTIYFKWVSFMLFSAYVFSL